MNDDAEGVFIMFVILVIVALFVGVLRICLP